MPAVARPTWVAANSTRSNPTTMTGSMTIPPAARSAPLAARCRERHHVAQRFPVDGLALGERPDGGVDGREEQLQPHEAGRDERGGFAARRVAAAAALLEGALGLGGRGERLPEVPAEAALHHLLHHAPEVRRRLVVVLARSADGRPAHEVPLDEAADGDRDVALALLQLGRDVVE